MPLSHSAAAAAHLQGNYDLVEQIKINPETAAVSDKLKSLLNIAGKVQQGGKRVTAEAVSRTKQHGATDKEIHDTVLIAAAFCMYNRYVDGLGTSQPQGREAYHAMGEQLTHQGYVRDRFKEDQKAAQA